MALIKGKQLSNNTLALTKVALQSEAEILVADSNGQLQAVSLGTDATITAAGALTIANDAINSAKIANGSVTFAKLNSGSYSTDLSSSATASELARADAAKAYADSILTSAQTYADNVANGLDIKASVRLASTAALTLATDVENGDSLDGIALVTGDRILLKDQADATENGIYVVAASGAPSRAADADQGDLTGGAFFFVEEGTANADNGFVCTTNGTPTLGTDNIVFAQFSGAGSVSAGAALTKTGNQLDVNVDDSTIEINNDTLRIKDAGITSLKLGNLSITPAKISPTVAGDGIAGGNGVALSVSLNELTAAVLDVSADSIAFIDATDSSTKKESVADFATALAGSGLTASSGALAAARLSSNDQFETASATSSNGDSAGVTIAATPEGMVQIFVNGLQQELGQGVKTKDCYFSADGGSTARAITAIASGDTLYWNGSVAGYQLDTNDKISMVYETA
jgi:hypothetical protein